ncbi:MAG: DsrE family protein [Methanoregula sp.]|jgi:tRNA 2-thiouridine synthesizing protein C|uniref:DsrE family protein n=1 Tax=Methanoregula sp. TaxID=2052170 RepID=UPI003C1DD6FB
MTSHFFLLSGPVTSERLSWFEESLKFYIIQIYPESLMYRTTTKSPVFTFFLTGDALVSLEDPETQQIWSMILLLRSVRIICDRKELDLRGISIEHLMMKNPNQLIDQNALAANNQPSFWNDVVTQVRQNRPPLPPDSIGWLQIESPYMHRSAWYGLQFLFSALESRFSVELYAYLDGIHMGHTGQSPTESENIGRGLEDLCDQAGKQGLTCQILACSRCATARGYSTWDDGKGVIISTCTIKPFKIRDMNAMIDRFECSQIIISENAGSIQFPGKGSAPSFDRAEQTSTAPPITILITKSPYSTEHAQGAIAFAATCAHQGILTRVVFLEDGIYALTGNQNFCPDSVAFNIQDLINAVAGNENLHLFALTPSFQKRGVTKNKNLNAVMDIGYPGLGKILFYLPGNVQADHQRVLIF